MSIFEKEYEVSFDDLKDLNIIKGSDENQDSSNNQKDIHIDYYQKVGLTVNYNDIRYEFIIFLIEDCDDILVLGPGFLNPERALKLQNKAVFDRHTWVNDFSQNLIYYNDPTRYDYENLNGGWGVGTPDEWHLENISEIIKILAEKITDYEERDIIPYSNIFFYGSSMGGFMGIVLSVLIKNSTSIADIPQFNVFKWHYWNMIHKICFGNMSTDEVYSKYGYRLDIFELIIKKRYIPNAYIVLDCSCHSDWEGQFEEFITNLNQLPYEFTNNINKLHLRIDGKNKGHSVLKKTDTIELVNNVVSLEKNLNQGDRKKVKFKLFSELNADVYTYTKQDLLDKDIIRYLNNNMDWDNLKYNLQESLEDNTASDENFNIDIKSTIKEHNLNQSLKKYYTCRIDLKNFGNEDNSIDIINISDKNVSLKYPTWYSNAQGEGAILKSTALNLEFNIRCIEDGNLQITLRGLEFSKDRDKQRIPLFIDILSFEIDDDVIVEKSRVICHDIPIRTEKEVKSGQVVNVKLRWRPLDKSSNLSLISFNKPLINENKIIKNENLALKNKNQEIIRENERISKELIELNNLNKSILESNSWKITKPLRAFRLLFKRFKK